MVENVVFLIVWIAVLALSYPYVQHAKHREAKALAAYLIFVTVLSTVTLVLFFALGWLLAAAGWNEILSQPVFAPIGLIVVFGPAFLIARWVLKKPPRRPPEPN